MNLTLTLSLVTILSCTVNSYASDTPHYNMDTEKQLVEEKMELNMLELYISGFFVRAAEGNEKIMEFLGVKENKQIVTCMIIGYPDVKYLRTVPRKDSDISWK